MSTIQGERPWDFSNVLNLINTLSTKDSTETVTPRSHAPTRKITSPNSEKLLNTAVGDGHERKKALGDFSNIWQYLGSPADLSAPKIPPAIDTSPTLRQRLPGKLEYISDGGVYPFPARRKIKAIQWRDETDGGNLTDVAPSKSDEDEESEGRLTKKQRYKKNKRERQRLEKAEAARRAASDLESEAEMHDGRNGPARKASMHNLSRQGSPGKRYNLRERISSDGETTKFSASHGDEKNHIARDQLNGAALSAIDSTQVNSTPAQPKASESIAINNEQERKKLLEAAVSAIANAQQRQEPSPKKEWPVSQPKVAHAKSLLPSTVQPSPHSTAKPPVLTHSNTQPVHVVAPQTSSKAPRHVIQPKTVRSGEDRNWAFLLKLISDFYEDRGNLIKPANLSNHSNDPKGIHVFVDASNIFIGFNDQLKRARNIPAHVHIPQVNMSFDALSLLMERRRPVAKRVLAGSTPHIPAFDVARDIGYQCLILDKVFKARELTDRQKYFYEEDQKRGIRGKRNSFHSSGYMSAGSGSENMTAAPTHAPEKYVEQGVDEILHLKILESVVDFEETPTTIVLATGDAAQAEYSDGFMKMVERALIKGWKVEVVSWSKNISQMYRRPAFTKLWGDKFRIIELDDYAEELLDM